MQRAGASRCVESHRKEAGRATGCCQDAVTARKATEGHWTLQGGVEGLEALRRFWCQGQARGAAKDLKLSRGAGGGLETVRQDFAATERLVDGRFFCWSC